MRKRPKHEPTDTYFYIAIQLSNSIMRADAFNLHVDPVRTEMTGTKQIMISYVCDSEKKENQKRSSRMKTYCRYVLRTRENLKDLLLMKVLRRRANQKEFTKVSTEIKKNMQLMKQSMKNLRLQRIQSSTRRSFSTYLSGVKTSWTSLMPCANELAWQTEGKSIIRKW